jgi:hypothetical protein
MSTLPEQHGSESKSVLKLTDEASVTLIYIGWADMGTPTSSAEWKIKRVQQVGNVWEERWADGNDSRDNIWNNRATLAYS